MNINVIASMDNLAGQIRVLEKKEAIQMAEFKQHVSGLRESLKPSSLIKGPLSSKLQSKAVDTSIGLVAGFLVKKIYQYKSPSIFKRVTGHILQLIITNLVAKKLPALRQKINHR